MLTVSKKHIQKLFKTVPEQTFPLGIILYILVGDMSLQSLLRSKNCVTSGLLKAMAWTEEIASGFLRQISESMFLNSTTQSHSTIFFSSLNLCSAPFVLPTEKQAFLLQCMSSRTNEIRSFKWPTISQVLVKCSSKTGQSFADSTKVFLFLARLRSVVYEKPKTFEAF